MNQTADVFDSCSIDENLRISTGVERVFVSTTHACGPMNTLTSTSRSGQQKKIFIRPVKSQKILSQR